MFGISFSELFVIAVVCLFLLDARDVKDTIVLIRRFLRKLFEIKDEVQETFADIGKEIKSDIEYVIGPDKKLHPAVDTKAKSTRIPKVRKTKKK
jgi:Sec-independent protein translocase protein TatA